MNPKVQTQVAAVKLDVPSWRGRASARRFRASFCGN